jgi:hypothetical protein
MDKPPTPPAGRPGAPKPLRLIVASDDLPAGDDPVPYDPASTRRPAGGTRRCPRRGPVVPDPYPIDHDDPAAPGDRCPSCGHDWPGGAPCAG